LERNGGPGHSGADAPQEGAPSSEPAAGRGDSRGGGARNRRQGPTTAPVQQYGWCGIQWQWQWQWRRWSLAVVVAEEGGDARLVGRGPGTLRIKKKIKKKSKLSDELQCNAMEAGPSVQSYICAAKSAQRLVRNAIVGEELPGTWPLAWSWLKGGTVRMGPDITQNQNHQRSSLALCLRRPRWVWQYCVMHMSVSAVPAALYTSTLSNVGSSANNAAAEHCSQGKARQGKSRQENPRQGKGRGGRAGSARGGAGHLPGVVRDGASLGEEVEEVPPGRRQTPCYPRGGSGGGRGGRKMFSEEVGTSKKLRN
jgi:hypothetical protein